MKYIYWWRTVMVESPGPNTAPNSQSQIPLTEIRTSCHYKPFPQSRDVSTLPDIREIVLDVHGTNELNPIAETQHINLMSPDLKASFRAGKLKTRPTLSQSTWSMCHSFKKEVQKITTFRLQTLIQASPLRFSDPIK